MRLHVAAILVVAAVLAAPAAVSGAPAVDPVQPLTVTFTGSTSGTYTQFRRPYPEEFIMTTDLSWKLVWRVTGNEWIWQRAKSSASGTEKREWRNLPAGEPPTGECSSKIGLGSIKPTSGLSPYRVRVAAGRTVTMLGAPTAGNNQPQYGFVAIVGGNCGSYGAAQSLCSSAIKHRGTAWNEPYVPLSPDKLRPGSWAWTPPKCDKPTSIQELTGTLSARITVTVGDLPADPPPPPPSPPGSEINPSLQEWLDSLNRAWQYRLRKLFRERGFPIAPPSGGWDPDWPGWHGATPVDALVLSQVDQVLGRARSSRLGSSLSASSIATLRQRVKSGERRVVWQPHFTAAGLRRLAALKGSARIRVTSSLVPARGKRGTRALTFKLVP
jgi:hypothetical protein